MPVLVGEAPITGATLSNSPTIDVGPAGKNRDTRLPTNSTFSEVPEVQGQKWKVSADSPIPRSEVVCDKEESLRPAKETAQGDPPEKPTTLVSQPSGSVDHAWPQP